MKEIIKKIEQWAVDKELHNSDSFRQFAKHCEETGEYLTAYSEGKSTQACLMELGDNVVTLTLLARQNGLGLLDCAYIGKPTNCEVAILNGDIAEALCKKDPEAMNQAIGNYYEWIGKQADLLNSTVEEAATLAYNKIADRTGQKIDGVFTKTEDLK